MACKFFDKKSEGSGRPLFSALQKANNKESIQLADELHKTIIRKFQKRKVYSSFIIIMLICSKDLDSYYALLIFIVNTLRLFH